MVEKTLSEAGMLLLHTCVTWCSKKVTVIYTSAQEKKNSFFFSRSLREQKFSNAKFRGVFAVFSARFRVSSQRRRNSAKLRGVSPRNFAHILRENPRIHLRNINRKTLMNLNYFNVNYSIIGRMVANSELSFSSY